MATKDPQEALLDRAQKGDREAFDRLLGACRPRLESVVRSRLGARLRREVDPDDVIQETALRAFQTVAKFRWHGEESFLRWLAGIAEHLIWNLSKKRPLEELRPSRDMPASGDSPLTRLRRRERLERLRAAIAHLKPEQRQAIELARFEGLKIQEIAARLGKSPGAVKQLLARALESLRDSFGDTESLGLPEAPWGDEENARGGSDE